MLHTFLFIIYDLHNFDLRFKNVYILSISIINNIWLGNKITWFNTVIVDI